MIIRTIVFIMFTTTVTMSRIPRVYELVYDKRCDCGKANFFPARRNHERIVGGFETDPHQFPWLALLHLNGTFICGATVISDRYVLSAAHCLRDEFNLEVVKVLLGEHNRCTADSNTILFSADRIYRHNRFSNKNFYADIMLIRVSMKITFNKFIQPICLPTYDITKDLINRYEGRQGMVVGWGKTIPVNGQPSCSPRQLQLPILDKNKCQIKSASLFCAGFVEGGKDSCQGDSGGPLQVLNSQNRYELLGIVSNGIGCALPKNPGLYTDVLHFLPWIWKHTADSSYCW